MNTNLDIFNPTKVRGIVEEKDRQIAELISVCEELSAVLISKDFTIFNLFENGDLGCFEDVDLWYSKNSYELSWEALIAAIKDPNDNNLGGYEGDDLPSHVQLYRRAQAVIAKARGRCEEK